MKNIPFFTTENGVASLILKEIPYRKEAFIHIQDSLSPEKLLEECIAFCTVCGAERIYATGDSGLERFKQHTAILEMRGTLEPDPDYIENIWPVTEQTVAKWREVYNERMALVDNAGTLEQRDEKRIIESGGAYFVHHAGDLLGIGWLAEDRIEAIAAVKPGTGKRVLHTLLSVSPGITFSLQVASTNLPAIALYQKNGFITAREVSRWYCVDKEKV